MESFFKKYVAENSKWNFFLRKMWQRKVKEESLSIPPGGSYPVSGIINMRWPGQYVGPHRQEIQIISSRNRGGQ